MSRPPRHLRRPGHPPRPAHRARRLRDAVVAATVPVALLAGCSSGGGSDDGAAPSGQATEERSPSPAPVRFHTLPDPCDTLSKKTIEDVVPKAESKGGKNLGSSDADSQGTCLWSGIRVDDDDYQFRSLSVSLKRYDSHTALGTGDERAEDYLQQQVQDVTREKGNKDIEDRSIGRLGDRAVALSFRSSKKDKKGKASDFREERIVVRVANVVVTVDYQGAGFEGSDPPSAKTVSGNAEKVAKEAVAALDKHDDKHDAKKS